MRLPGLDLLHRVVVVHPQKHIVGRSDKPRFPHDELGAAHRQIANFEGLNHRLEGRGEEREGGREGRRGMGGEPAAPGATCRGKEGGEITAQIKRRPERVGQIGTQGRSRTEGGREGMQISSTYPGRVVPDKDVARVERGEDPWLCLDIILMCE